MQKQCCWCGRLGARYDERELKKTGERPPMPHDDGSACVCRHVSAASREAALEVGGRYWNGSKWVCTVCAEGT